MIRNLKTLVVAAVAVLALGAVGAAAAQAHVFKTPGTTGTTNIKVTPDGTGKTAHQVFDIYNAAKTETKTITCNKIGGETTVSGATQTNVTVNPLYEECTFLGQAATVNTTGCNYNFSAEGSVNVECSGTNKITFGALNCNVSVGSQNLTGITYHNIETGGNKEVTVSSLVAGIAYTASGTECPYGSQTNGEYTTGNAITTGTRGGVMVPVEWE